MNKLIVLDGLDGCGKSTQLDLLINFLRESNSVKKLSFPAYDKDTSIFIKKYLKGDFGTEDVNAYQASSFYALDRYASFIEDWQDDYNDNNTLIVSGRYTTSNLIYNLAKLPKEEWEQYIDWVTDYEYNKLGIPQPDLVIFLDMPIMTSQKLLSERYNGDESKKDIHESNVNYLSKCRDCALYLAKKFKWEVINCVFPNNDLKPIRVIQYEIQEIIKEWLQSEDNQNTL